MDETLALEEAERLIEHCRAGRLYEIERWISSGKSIKVPLTTKKSLQTPLHIAIQTGFHSLVELLIRNEPLQEAKNRALEEAVSIKRLDLVQLVVEYGAEIKAVPLIDVLLTSKPDLIRYFLENGADAITDHPFESAFRKEVWTSWQAFTRYRKTHTELATELQKQADCALRYFASEGNEKWVRLLMSAGADPRSSGSISSDNDPKEHTTAFKEACDTRNLNLLKKMKPDPAKDDLTKLLNGTSWSTSADVIRYLIKLGAHPNNLPNGGSSLLNQNLCHLDLYAQSGTRQGDLTPKYLVRHGLDCIQALVEGGALWRPEDRNDLVTIRRTLMKFDPDVTSSILQMLFRHKAASPELMEQLLDSPRMKEHMAGLGIKL